VGEFPEEVEDRLGPLYRDRPEDFVAARDALARDLRGEGDRESAEQVKRLRRPSAAAWVINRLSADEPERTRALVRASDELAEAQRRVLSGEAEGDELREAAAAEREQIDAFAADARRLAAAQGANVAAVVDRVVDTLRSVGADAELRGRVLRGRVEKEQTAATVGIPADAKPPRRTSGRPAPRVVERGRRELTRLRRELADAEARRDSHAGYVEDAEAGLKRARADLRESKRAVRDLERQIERTERRASS
jgi:hypothetical protein